jgi:hypothetical protein
MPLKNSSDAIGSRTCGLPVCSALLHHHMPLSEEYQSQMYQLLEHLGIHVVVMKCLIMPLTILVDLPLLIHIELL